MVFHQKQNTYGTNHFNCYIYDNTVWESHFHKDFEIIHVLSGEVVCTIGERQFLLCNGGFAMCLPYEIHSYIPQNKAKYIVWGFSESYVRTFSIIINGKKGITSDFSCSDSITRYVLSLSYENTELSPWDIKSLLYALCGQYLKCVTLQEMDVKESHANDMILFIENNYQNNITLSDAAKYLGYDYHYVSRFFKKNFNMNFHDFLTTYRLQSAIKLLEETDKPVTRIAFESGFQSIRAFNDCFKKHTGKSPSHFRKGKI